MAPMEDPAEDREPPETPSEGGHDPSPVAPDYVPSRRGDVVEIDLEDGIVLFDPASSLVHHLNGTAGLVWRRCDGTTSVSRMSAEIAGEFGLDPIEIGRQVAILITEMGALSLIEDLRDRA